MEGDHREGFVVVVNPLDGFQCKALAVYGIYDIDIVVVSGFNVEDRFATAAFHEDQLIIFRGEEPIADKVIKPVRHDLNGPGAHSVGCIHIGGEDEFVVISVHGVVVPKGIAGIRLDDIGGIAEAVRIILGVDN